jgi:hypothetical protein
VHYLQHEAAEADCIFLLVQQIVAPFARGCKKLIASSFTCAATWCSTLQQAAEAHDCIFLLVQPTWCTIPNKLQKITNC